MSEVWTESHPLLSVTELSGMLLILICQRPAWDIATSTARDTIPMWEVADTEAIPLFTTTIHVPTKLPQVQLCRHASKKTYNVPIPALMTNSIPGKTAMNVAGRTAAHEDQALCILSIYVHIPSWFECKPKSTPLCNFCFPSMENNRSALVATNFFILWLKSSSCRPGLSI